MLRLLLSFLFVCTALVKADDQSNVLLYTDPVQVSSSVDAYDSLAANVPIKGSVMVTHQKNTTVDNNSFRLGDKPLKVQFVQTTTMPYSNLQVAIYQFQLDGMKTGQYTLPSIFVKVSGKEYQAPPLTLQIGNE